MGVTNTLRVSMSSRGGGVQIKSRRLTNASHSRLSLVFLYIFVAARQLDGAQ